MTEDERLAQEYLEKLQESVGRGEISLAEYDRLSDLALSNIPTSSQVAHAELARRSEGIPVIPSDPTVYTTAPKDQKSAPMWVILPGIIFPAIHWLREYL